MPHNNYYKDLVADVYIVFENKVLLRMHDKYNVWLAPGGHVDPGESPDEAAIREAKEEVGLNVMLVGDTPEIEQTDSGYQALVPPRFMDVHPITDTHKHVSLVFFARSDTHEVIPEHTSDRSDDWHWFTREELEENDYGIKPAIVHYACIALEELGKT